MPVTHRSCSCNKNARSATSTLHPQELTYILCRKQSRARQRCPHLRKPHQLSSMQQQEGVPTLCNSCNTRNSCPPQVRLLNREHRISFMSSRRTTGGRCRRSLMCMLQLRHSRLQQVASAKILRYLEGLRWACCRIASLPRRFWPLLYRRHEVCKQVDLETS